MIITILDESGPAPLPNIYRSGPVVSEEANAMPEEAPANKRPRSFRTGIQDTEFPQYPDGDGEYPEDSGEYPEESRGNLGINWNLKVL